jgi:hypothetical protein
LDLSGTRFLLQCEFSFAAFVPAVTAPTKMSRKKGATAMLSLSLNIVSRPAPPPLKILVASGGGYAGSLYRASQAGGQWHADGTPIAGATASEWVMTQALEGVAITYRVGSLSSNVIEMWMPTDLAASYRANGGWWDAKRGVTVANGKVSAIADQFGVRSMSQAVTANQPDYSATTSDGGPAMTWPDGANTRFLAPAAAFAPAYWMLVIRYRNGTVSTFPSDNASPEGDYPAIISTGGSPNRVIGERGAANLFQSSVWSNAARKNAAASPSAILLPLPKSLVEFQGTPVNAAWSLGRGAGAAQDDPALARGWRGAIFEVIALGAVPDADSKDALQGFLAWHNRIQDSLPTAHRYKNRGPARS